MRRENAGAGSPTGISRRSFLKGSALATASALAAGALAGCESQEDQGGGAPEAAPKAAATYEVYTTDLLVLGGGYEGTQAAIHGLEKGLNVIVVDKGPFGFSGDAGFNWGVYVSDWNTEDPTTATLIETLATGGLNDQAVTYGMNKLKVETGGLCARAVNHGTSTLLRHADDGTVYELNAGDMSFYKAIYPRHESDYAASKGLQVFDRTMITEFIVQDGIFTGAMGIHLPTGTLRVFRAKAGIETPGSNSWMFGWYTVGPNTPASPDNTGDLHAIALRKGCRLHNMDQMGGDMLMASPSGIAFSYNGTIGCDPIYKDLLMDADGDYWMRDMEVDTSSFLIECGKKIREGKGGPNGGLFLDLRDVDGKPSPMIDQIGPYFRRNLAPLKERFGIDVSKDLVEVAPEIAMVWGHPLVDANSMCDLPGLFCGGSSRAMMPSNNHYFGTMYAVDCAHAYMKEVDLTALTEEPWAQVEAEFARLHEIRNREVEGSLRPHEVRRKIQKTVGDNLGIFRNGEGMRACLDELRRIREEDLPRMTPARKSTTYNTEWKEALENINMLDFSECMAVSSIAREESRGSWIREDFPGRDDENFFCKIAVSYDDGQFNVEKVDPDRSIWSADELLQMMNPTV